MNNPQATPDRHPVAVAEPAHPVDLDPPRCLVVEDDRVLARLLVSRMGLDGYRVTAVSDGAEVLDKVGTWHPDVILMDMMLPHVNGIEICRLLKSEGAWSNSIPVVMLTAYSSTEMRAEAVAAGADAFVAKPFNGNQLRRVIDGLVTAHRAEANSD